MKRIILSLDTPVPVETFERIVPHVGGVKVGWPLILSLGKEGLRRYLRQVDGLRIFDLKLADIDNTMKLIVNQLRDIGDAFIAHSFVGFEGSLSALASSGVDVFLVVSMSHEGWNDTFYPYLREVARKVNPKGLVAPATRPNILRKVREDFQSKIIVSPGVGAQGAKPGLALCNGANYEIVGRSIYQASDPVGALEEIYKTQEEVMRTCEGAKTVIE
ncbi:MAG: orotidine 5'-phosphate decarboxylase / HUMPS family protein [Metallosphaera sp.]